MSDDHPHSLPPAYPVSGAEYGAVSPMRPHQVPYQQPQAAMSWSRQPGYSAYGAAVGPFGNVVEMGKLGAVVGLCGAGAASLHRLQAGELDTRDALLETLRGGAVAGVATAAATLVGARIGSGLLSLAATLATGTAVAYALTAESTPDAAVAAADAAAESNQR